MKAPSPFCFIGPHWPELPNVEAFSVVARTRSEECDFRSTTTLGAACQKKLEALTSPAAPIFWPTQPHGGEVVFLPDEQREDVDGVVTTTPNLICAVRTADCLPLLMASKKGDVIAAAHGGWRGLKNGILQNALSRMAARPEDILVWLGPAISGPCYEVGPEFADHFAAYTDEALGVFEKKSDGKFFFDLYALAKIILREGGVPPANISGGDFCTFSDHRMASVRRDGAEKATRMASVVWMR